MLFSSLTWRSRAKYRGVLTDRAIRRSRANGELFVEPFDPALVRPASLSLRLGAEAFSLQSQRTVDVADRTTHPDLVAKSLDARGRLVVEPGELVLAPTWERIGLSKKLVGLVDGISDYARLGVSVLCGQVSPGFGMERGAVLTLEIVNHLRHPVLLYPGARICNLMLFASPESEQAYGAMPHNYSNDQAVVASRLADHVRYN
ncbi:dCTP deaminase [Amycolatopsis sp. NEAU-NG30]|uniref:dCTP deaminase n=1 Tax=Amycolatopsis melonis TaxID=3156488 RepID=A0ABV0LH49_9PSEU